MYDGMVRSRSWKPFPNDHVDKLFSKKLYNGLDGELIVGDPTAKDVYRVTNGSCQRHDGQPDVKFYVLDTMRNPDVPYNERSEFLSEFENDHVVIVEQILVQNEKSLLKYEEHFIELGYEGLMLRDPKGKYKFGRATVNSGELLKLKRFEDSEAEIIDYYEEMHNANEAKKDAFGRTERSSHQANLIGKGRLGGIVVRDVKTGVEFSIGSGFTQDERIDLWKKRGSLKGLVVKYKYFAVGVKDKPRHPVYLGFRAAWDKS